jgi:hypothetical protein
LFGALAFTELIYRIAVHLQLQRYLLLLSHRIALRTLPLWYVRSRVYPTLRSRILHAMFRSTLPCLLTIGCYVAFHISLSEASSSTAAIVGMLVFIGAGSALARLRPSATIGRLFESQLPGRVAFARLGGKQVSKPCFKLLGKHLC